LSAGAAHPGARPVRAQGILQRGSLIQEVGQARITARLAVDGLSQQVGAGRVSRSVRRHAHQRSRPVRGPVSERPGLSTSRRSWRTACSGVAVQRACQQKLRGGTGSLAFIRYCVWVEQPRLWHVTRYRLRLRRMVAPSRSVFWGRRRSYYPRSGAIRGDAGPGGGAARSAGGQLR